MNEEPVLTKYKAIQFPGVDANREAEIRKFIRTTGEFMECDIEVVAVVAIEIRVPSDRADVATIVGKAAANEKKRK